MIQKGIYKHYKGKMYRVIDVAHHSENLEKYVIYQALYDDYEMWIRPYKMFIENIEIDGKSIPRFTFINQEIADYLQEKI
jgi:hypothetical protein